jgi:hypothetical protein
VDSGKRQDTARPSGCNVNSWSNGNTGKLHGRGDVGNLPRRVDVGKLPGASSVAVGADRVQQHHQCVHRAASKSVHVHAAIIGYKWKKSVLGVVGGGRPVGSIKRLRSAPSWCDPWCMARSSNMRSALLVCLDCRRGRCGLPIVAGMLNNVHRRQHNASVGMPAWSDGHCVHGHVCRGSSGVRTNTLLQPLKACGVGQRKAASAGT